MQQDDEIRVLKARIDDLESRLNRYHEYLENAVDQRDKFVLGSSWGIVIAVSGGFAFFGVLYVFKNWLELTGWIWDVVAVFIALFAWGMAASWQQGGQEKDEQKLHRLPKWKDKLRDFYD
jgi:cobalamin biosynthesis protein CobD/CbiB